MVTKAMIEIEGEFISVNKLLEKINEFMHWQKDTNRPVDRWKLEIVGGD